MAISLGAIGVPTAARAEPPAGKGDAAAQALPPAPVRTWLVTPTRNGPWTIRVDNTGDHPVRIPADVRLLRLELVASDGRRAKRTVRCDLGELRPDAFPDRRALYLAPSQSWVETFDPRLICCGTDAELLPAGATHDWAAGTWTYPSRAQCLQCHSEPAGRTLGLTTAQLNGDYAYPWGETVNQLDRLGRIGVFADTTDPTAVDPAQVAALPRVDSDAPVADRARAWLDVNCAHCHQPGGGGLGALDLRYATPMADAGLCGAPENGDLGVPGALIVTPGAPEASVLSLRLHATDANRMPAVATHTPDPVGTALVDAWITGMEACP